MSFSENLRKFRNDLGLTQEQLARRVNISAQAVSKWERGDSLPDPATLPAISDALGVSLDRLFDRDSESFHDLAHHIYSFFAGDNSMHTLRRIACLAAYSRARKDVSDHTGHSHSRSIRITAADGFVLGSNSQELPFFGIFEEPKAGWKACLHNLSACSKFFAALGMPGVLQAICKLYEYNRITFDAHYAADSLEINGQTLTHLCEIGVLTTSETEINGEVTTLYRAAHDEGLIALLILTLHCIRNDTIYDFCWTSRTAPLF